MMRTKRQSLQPNTRRYRAAGIGLIGLAMCFFAACDSDDGVGPGLVDVPGDDPGGGFQLPKKQPTILDDREIDYGVALRTAALKLTDITPTLGQIRDVQDADDQQAAYNTLVDEMFESPRFQRRMIRWWKDIFRQGDSGLLNTAPTFAARVMVEGQPYTELFTATENTCPSYDNDADAFVDGDCNNGVETHAGVLTNPGTMAQFYGNMAFRRVRWVQEVFACQKFPAEYADTPQNVGGATYTGPWSFESIGNDPIDFQDTESVVCANCHVTMNHMAPLFANFDEDGQWQATIQVITPTAPDPVPTELSHWLAEGETTAWRQGVPAEDLPALGQALAADPDVAQCVVARLWNFTMSKEDIVNDLATVPSEVIEKYVSRFQSDGFNMKDTLKDMFKSEDFVSF